MSELANILIITNNKLNNPSYSASKKSITYVYEFKELSNLNLRNLRGMSYSNIILVGVKFKEIPTEVQETLNNCIATTQAFILEL